MKGDVYEAFLYLKVLRKQEYHHLGMFL